MKRKGIFAALGLMAIGFAAVSSTLYINNTARITKNSNDFKVYYSDAYVNGEQDKSVIVDSTHISFETTMNTIGQKYILDYDVTNGSKNYDADLVMNCTGSNAYVSVTNEFNTTDSLLAQDTRSGKLTLELIKSNVGDDISTTIVCTLAASATERTKLAGETPNVEKCEWEYEDLDDNGELSVGDRYSLCTESFYVTSTNENEVNMLAAYNIGYNNKQVSGEEYYGLNSEDYENNPTAVEDYINYLKQVSNDDTITFRDIELDELDELGCSYDNRTCYSSENKSWLLNGQFWWTNGLEVFTIQMPYAVYPGGSIASPTEDFDWDGNAGHRPIITVKRSILGEEAEYFDAVTFCQNKGFEYGMLAMNTYALGAETTGNYDDAEVFCSDHHGFDCDTYGYLKTGEEVYSDVGGCSQPDF